MKPKKVLVLLEGSYPYDIRVKKEIHALLQDHHEFTIACYKGSTSDHPAIRIVEVPLVHLKFWKGIFDVLNVIFGMYIPYFFAVQKTSTHFDLIHVHDLPLFSTAEKLRSRGQKIILDLHENYPQALKVWFSKRKSPVIRLKNQLFFQPAVWTKREKRAVELADQTICVVDEMKERLIQQGASPEKLVVIGNSEEPGFARVNPDCKMPSLQPQTLNLLYIGNYGPHRGLDTVIRSLKFLPELTSSVQFHIVGKPNNSGTDEWLKAIALSEGVSEQVVFHGAEKFDCFFSWMCWADINVVPHQSNEHTESTIPHKLYQSLMSGKALLVSSCRPLKRVVETHGIGYVFEADNAQSCAAQIAAIHSNPPESRIRAERGRQAVLHGALSWEQDAAALRRLYRALNRD